MDEQHHGMSEDEWIELCTWVKTLPYPEITTTPVPQMDWLMMELDNLQMRSSIERVGDDILVCDGLEEEEVFDDFRFAREQEDHIGTETKEKTMRELMNEELDVSKEMELLKKAYKKHKKK